ncbi:MAG: MaoC/PaaZ C-terminal domain-containing protein [Rhizobiaceae bacterium]
MNLPPFFEPGHSVEIGSHRFDAEDIVRFATRYDPQPFHIDPEKAKNSLFGGHCASGWHTISVWMRKQRDFSAQALVQWVAAGNPPYEYGPSPGFDNLVWSSPVYAGDTVRFVNTTIAGRASNSRPGWYVISGRQQGFKGESQQVLSVESSVFIRYPAA